MHSPLPERPHLHLGFLPLTDCAPLVVAQQLNLGEAHGLTLELHRQPSWAAVRDKLLTGELDAAHALYGLVYGVQLGLGGPQADMAILMTLNRNGQAITVSPPTAALLRENVRLQDALATLGRRPVFAQTFPTGTHAMWLNNWLARQGLDPLADVDSIVIPPAQMVDALAAGVIDGFCAGEPWHAVAQARGVGRTVACTSEIWPDHPEKALACRRDFAALYPATCVGLIRTLLDACTWLAQPENRIKASDWLAQPEYIGIDRTLILPRLIGDYGSAPLVHPPMTVHFGGDAASNRPDPREGLWFMEQYCRWQLMQPFAEMATVAEGVSQTVLFQAALDGR